MSDTDFDTEASVPDLLEQSDNEADEELGKPCHRQFLQ